MNIGDIYWGTREHEFHPIVCLESTQNKTMFAAAILSSKPHDDGNITNIQLEESHFDRSNPAYTIYVDQVQGKVQYLVNFKWLKDCPSLETKIEGHLSSQGLLFVVEKLKDSIPQRVTKTIMEYNKSLPQNSN